MKTVEELAGEYANENYDIAMVGMIYHNDIEKAYSDGYNKAKEWISVDDELPELERRVLVLTKK